MSQKRINQNSTQTCMEIAQLFP